MAHLGEIFNFLLLAVLTIYFARLLFRAPFSVNKPGVRQLFLRHMRALCPEMRVLDEQADSLSLQIGTQVCTIQLEQLYRRCMEWPAQVGPLIQQATGGVEAALHDDERLPPEWEQQVVPLLMCPDSALLPDLLIGPISDQLSLGYVVRADATFRWVTTPMLAATQSADALHALALRNLERSCSSLIIDTPGEQPDGQEHYLRFITGDGLDAARLLIPSLHGRFSPRFAGDDLLVAIPTRDTLYMIGARDGAIANLLSYRGLWEHSRRAYPLTDRLLLITELGVQPWPPANGVISNQ